MNCYAVIKLLFTGDGPGAKTHVGRLLTKLQARDRTGLVVIAYETGLVTPSGPGALE
jgi:DNA-binding CsgD family transcriptional regulator